MKNDAGTLEATPSSKPPSRAGKRAFSVYLKPDVLKQVRQLALDRDTTIQKLGEEAVSLLLREYKVTGGR